MKLKSFIASDHIVKAALEGRLKVLIQLVKPQPKDCSDDHKLYNGGDTPWAHEPMTLIVDKKENEAYCKYCGNGVGWGGIGIRAPYPPDSLIYFREAWAFAPKPGEQTTSQTKIILKSECSPEHHKLFRWQSPATMPQAAARIYAKPEESYPKRVQEINSEEAVFFVGVDILIDEMHPLHKRAYELGTWDAEDQSWYAGSIEAFRAFWELRHPGSWERNDWIWLTPVSVISTTGKPTI